MVPSDDPKTMFPSLGYKYISGTMEARGRTSTLNQHDHRSLLRVDEILNECSTMRSSQSVERKGNIMQKEMEE